MTAEFELDGTTHELTNQIQEYFITRVRSAKTIDVYFDEHGVLYHEFKEAGEFKQTTVDVIEVFETYPSQARRVLKKIGEERENTTVFSEESLVRLDEFR